MLHQPKLRARCQPDRLIIAALKQCSERASYFYDELCWMYDASEWASLPQEVVSQITRGLWDNEIAELLNQGLIEVEIPGDFWARIDGLPVDLAA